MLFVFTVTTLAAVVGIYTTPPLYTAKASLFVNLGREFVYQPEVGSDATAPTFRMKEMVNSIVEILGSRDLAEHVVRQISVEEIYPKVLEDEEDPGIAIAKAVAKLQSSLVVIGVVESSIIKVSFGHEKPKVAAHAVNLLLEKFQDKHVEIFGTSRSGFLQQQVERYSRELADAEKALESFRHEHSIYDPVQQKAAIVTAISALEADLRDTDLSISELQTKLKSLKSLNGGDGSAGESGVDLANLEALTKRREAALGQLRDAEKILFGVESQVSLLTAKMSLFERRASNGPGGVSPHPGVEKFKSLDDALVRLLDLQLKEKDLASNYKRNSRQLVAVRDEIAIVNRFLSERGNYIESLLRSSIREELDAFKAQRKDLRAQVDAINKSIEDLDTAITNTIRAGKVQEVRWQLDPLEERRAKIMEKIYAANQKIQKLDALENSLNKLEHQETVKREKHQVFVQRLEHSRMTEELNQQRLTNIQVVEKAAPPVSASGLSKTLKLALAVAVGLFAAVAVAFLLELLAPGEE